VNDQDCVELLQWACPRLGLRWDGFRQFRGQVCKRIARRMMALGLTSVAQYLDTVEASASEWSELEAACHVTITRFYRDRAVFDALRRTWLPKICEDAAREARPVRLWSAGACSGEEPFTVAMMFQYEFLPRWPDLRVEIIASEMNDILIERAREGRYPSATLRELPAEWREQAFVEEGDALQLREDVRAMVELRHEDIRRSHPTAPFDVILCRNVAFTYFDESSQREMLRWMRGSLRDGGILVIGGHEQLPEASGFKRAGREPIFVPEP
jgi:chemotaxis protein methyltransferase CheR